ncbi:cell cycle control protein cdc123 [Grosmannia clavigera kw1407]|uniref:Cell cycle control protein cdc123 n=1 Tax=Grosmannia clavigera (strain kw1407 / UAMH 11150) TaxID=655863 RepID=F0XUG6_GROCL|nr:cell cycle control protein cdc123 [Grosmannia clavigera kw1407]EFW98702.1 cell cycle control protein cdc123 [Grosmannia clavigera kw1407]
MPEFHTEAAPAPSSGTDDEGSLFPPVSRDHILYCSYDYWFPKYRKVCIKSRLIELPAAAIEYLREDGIVLSDESNGSGEDDDDDWEPSNPTMKHYPSADETKYQGLQDDDSSDEDENAPATIRLPPNKRFPEVHQRIKDEIAALGGSVAPKLNWSSPKDATWLMAEKNTMQCRTPDDVYLLLKSSNFITHDLEHAFDGCIPASAPMAPSSTSAPATDSSLGFQPVLVLRSSFNMHTALEFRCFVKHRNLVAITPRDLKYYPYLKGLRNSIIERAKTLFHSKLQFTFPSGSFSFDIYMPERDGFDVGDNEARGGDAGGRLSWARLIDINPWAPRTDTLLFSWRELLDLKIPKPFLGIVGESGVPDEAETASQGDETDEDEEEESGNDTEDYEPELRLVEKDDPAAMNFSSAPYSAHKLPKEVVDASMAGEGGLRKFAQEWQEIVERREGR